MPRSYVVGLPVVITIEDDGTVKYETDIADAAEGVLDEETSNFNGYDEATVKADYATITADIESKR